MIIFKIQKNCQKMSPPKKLSNFDPGSIGNYQLQKHFIMIDILL